MFAEFSNGHQTPDPALHLHELSFTPRVDALQLASVRGKGDIRAQCDMARMRNASHIRNALSIATNSRK